MLIVVQGSNHSMAVLVELRLWPIPALEYSHDQRHLSLATADHACHCSWVCPIRLPGRDVADGNRLPGAPLWLAAVYSDKFAPINKYWVPAMW